MVPNSMMFRAASALTAVVILLVLPNWFTKPEAALAWTAVLAMCAVMVAALQVSRRAVRHSTAKATAVSVSIDSDCRRFRRAHDGHPAGADTRPLVPRRGRRRPGSSLDQSSHRRVPRDARECHAEESPTVVIDVATASRQQAFQRLVGWTWVLCGLGSALVWLALSIDAAETAAMVLVVLAMVGTLVQLRLRLRRPRKDPHAPGLH